MIRWFAAGLIRAAANGDRWVGGNRTRGHLIGVRPCRGMGSRFAGSGVFAYRLWAVQHTGGVL